MNIMADGQSKALKSLDLESFLDDRDYLHTLVNEIDWQSQLLAVRLMISRNRKEAEAFSDAIKNDAAEVNAYSGSYHDHWVGQHVDMIHESVYRDAAESMAAIGMVAPLIESTFGQALAALGDLYERRGLTPGTHKRWKRAKDHVSRWNVQFYFDDKGNAKNNIILGLPQLAAACGLAKFLPSDFMRWFEAMFIYRNFMFHGGFEWTTERRQLFKEAIEKNNWDQWFTCSTSNDRPWIYYIRDEAIDKLTANVEDMLDSLGRFARSLPVDLICNT